jgi:hypothetical protein
MKKIMIVIFLLALSLRAQTEERFYEFFDGGGIGYTPSLLIMPDIAFPAMPQPLEIAGQRYVHGVSGWSSLINRWRIGAQILSGKISSAGTIGADLEKSEFSITSGMLLTEYAIPLSHNNQFAVSFAFGISQISLSYQRSSPAVGWSDLFANRSSQILTARSLPTVAPQLSWLWQFSRRAGFRVNAGAHLMSISPSVWKLNDYITVTDAYGNENALIISPMVQIFIYFGA